MDGKASVSFLQPPEIKAVNIQSELPSTGDFTETRPSSDAGTLLVVAYCSFWMSLD